MPVRSSHPLFHIALLMQRLALGLFVLLQGVSKFHGGLEQFVNGLYHKMTPAFLPSGIAVPYGYAIPFLEVIFGSLLIVGLFGQLAAVVLLLMVISFTIALAYAGLAIGGPGIYSHNFMFLAMLFLLAVTGAGRYSVDRLWRGRTH